MSREFIQLISYLTLIISANIALFRFKKTVNPVEGLKIVALIIPFRIFVTPIIRLSDLVILLWLLIYSLLVVTRKLKLKSNQISKPLYLFIFVTIISLLIASIRWPDNSSNDEVISSILAFSLMVSAFSVINTKNDLESILKYWLLGSVIVSFISISSYFLSGFGLKTVLGFSNLSIKEFYEAKFASSIFFEDPNNYAFYLLPSIFISMSLVMSQKNKTFYVFSTVLLLFSLSTTFSRSSFLSIFLVIFFIVFVRFTSLKTKIGLIMLAIIFLLPQVIELASTFLFNDISAGNRVNLWKAGIKIAVSFPLLGVGLGKSPFIFTGYLVESNLSLLTNTHAHNLFIKVASEMGIIALIIFIYTMHLLIENTFKKSLSQHSMSIKILQLGLISMLLQSMGVEYFSSRHFWLYIGLLGASLTGKHYEEELDYDVFYNNTSL